MLAPLATPLLALHPATSQHRHLARLVILSVTRVGQVIALLTLHHLIHITRNTLKRHVLISLELSLSVQLREHRLKRLHDTLTRQGTHFKERPPPLHRELVPLNQRHFSLHPQIRFIAYQHNAYFSSNLLLSQLHILFNFFE